MLYGTKSGAVQFQSFMVDNFTFPLSWAKGHQESVAPKVSLPSQPTMFSITEESGPFWRSQAFDSDRGIVRGAGTSYDDSHYFAVSQDGGIFVWRVQSVMPQQSTHNEKDLAAADSKIKGVSDIIDTATYSIQEAKLKSERDRESMEAEEHKKTVRKDISGLRERFSAALTNWKQSTAYSDDKRWQISINPGLKEQIGMF